MWQFYHKTITTSTNDDAAQIGSPYAVVVADTQTSGRGRMGRSWLSPQGGLYASFAVPCPETPHHLAMVAAVAVAGLDSRLLCKWPNDVMLDGKKIAGILIETGNDIAVIGIGVNLTPNDIGGFLPLDRDYVLDRISNNLRKYLEVYNECGFGVVRQKWLQVAYKLGQTVQVGDKAGIFTGITDNGFMVLDNETVIISPGA